MSIISKTPSIRDVAVSEYRRIHQAFTNVRVNNPEPLTNAIPSISKQPAVDISISSLAKSLNQGFITGGGK